MNQANSVKRSLISFGLAVIMSLLALFIQNLHKPSYKMDVQTQSNTYPKEFQYQKN